MRDGRRQRLGLGGTTTATLNAGEDPGNISTSGLGSLINMSDLYNNALAGENATTGNQAYLDRILEEQGPDTLTLDPNAFVNTRDNRYINDAYNYYLGGGTGDFADEVALTGGDTTTNVDTGDGGEGQATIQPNTPITTDITSDQIDEFQTTNTTMPPMLSPDMGASIITDTTPADMSPLADEQFVSTDSGLDDIDMNVIDNPFADTPVVLGSGNNALGLEDPQSLAIGPDGAVNLQTGPGIDSYVEGIDLQNPDAGAPIEQAPPGIMNPYDPSQSTVLGANPDINSGGLEDILDQAEIPEEPLDGEDYLGTSTPQEINIDSQVVSDPSAVNTILGSDGITYDAVTGNPIYEDLDAQASATTLELNQIQDESLKGQLSEIFTSAKNAGKSAIETAQELVNSGIGTYNDLNKTINIPGLGEIDVGKTLGGLALNTAFGAPISLAMYAVNQIPKSQSQLDYEGFSDEKKAAVDSIYGPGGVMEGYNAVSALGEGVDETIQGRIDDFQKNYTAEELAAMSPTGTYNKLLDAKEKTGGTGINPNDQIDIDNQINLEKELDDPPAYDAPSENITTDVTSNQINEFNIDPAEDYDFSDFDDGDTSVAADVLTGSDPVDSFFDTVDQGNNVYQGGGSDSSTVDSSGNVTDSSGQSQGNINDEFSQPESTYQTGTVQRPGSGGGDSSPGPSGGTHCCTAANERGDMTLLEVKKLRVWHRKQSKIWQKGYDVWGRVMADHLVSKYKWSSDRVRDFYNHKIYGKRTIGSTFADLCIYPMSMVIGCILTVMPPILGYQKQENKND
jgi:hypothetical protein